MLGGTTEASEFARRLSDAGIAVVLSLAGRTARPVVPTVDVRVGGFGGIAGLERYLQEAGVTAVIDATHPFAARMAANAAAAATAAAVPRLKLLRPGWSAREGDRWTAWPTPTALAAALPAGARIFLAMGRQDLASFAGRSDCRFLLRTVDPLPAEILPAGATAILGRGPFTLEDEEDLLRRHEIDLVVSRNAGGTGAAAKLTAARRLGLPVWLVERPAPPPGPLAATVDEAFAWARKLMS